MEYSLSDKTFIITINIFNNKKICRVKAEVFNIRLFVYDTQTRTTNLYLKICENDTCIIKQFDYKPWTQDKMKEILNTITKLKET